MIEGQWHNQWTTLAPQQINIHLHTLMKEKHKNIDHLHCVQYHVFVFQLILQYVTSAIIVK